MIADDVYRSQLQGTIAGLKYWIPEIKDVAHVTEETNLDFWKVSVTPHVAGACPFELMLRTDRKHDLSIAGELYEERPTSTLDVFLPLVQAIAAGQLVQRRLFAKATHLPLSIDTIVSMSDGTTWQAGRALSAQPAAAAGAAEIETRDRHFLPYRR
jgi:hypothetical protein